MTPTRSLTQRRDALAQANAIRVQRAKWKRDLKARRVSVAFLLKDPPRCIETMKVIDLLISVPQYGSVRACQVSPVKTVGGLTDRQRRELIQSFYR